MILGIDCSTRWTNIGVAIEGRIAGEFNMFIGRRQSSELPSLVENILSGAGLTLESVDAVAVTSGPGYFTGIRVGLSYACAIAEGIGKKVVLVDSLLALAAPFLNGTRLVFPVIRARRGYVYSSALSGCLSNAVPAAAPRFLPVGELTCGGKDDALSLLIVDDDEELMKEIAVLKAPNIAKSSIRGGYVALLGDAMFDKAVFPTAAIGNYLREPDIGKRKYTE
ncbi:MAG: tRNA (adenosine(37)-N6)-threonylcarbamoyltransferase complex dimerization subunit type 1 TsaB [Thermovirgaceae bacterium]|nr:tRNA (adenosine(37)-N6)-threonylcarbamoyltransferase complex dimerization subunit type 1 TsaB [Thermovirgaceae bacterium]